MPELTDLTDEVTTLARDAAYVVVGLGVLALQRAQVQRAELRQRLGGDLEGRLADVRVAVADGVQQLDGAVEVALGFVESALQPLEEQLPPVARGVTDRAHAQVRGVHRQIRELVAQAS